jgi:hypothetical protein
LKLRSANATRGATATDVTFGLSPDTKMGAPGPRAPTICSDQAVTVGNDPILTRYFAAYCG